ncbi:MAG TPA: hypothetical protein VGT41_02695 [Candidatus Babeliales bacterium]|nr:hypothetical protein [Candidatus Babeliales bacterium]
MQRVYRYLRTMVVAIAIVSCISRGAEEKGEEESKEQRGVFEARQNQAEAQADQIKRDEQMARGIAEQEAIRRLQVQQTKEEKEMAARLRKSGAKADLSTVDTLSLIGKKVESAPQRDALGNPDLRRHIAQFAAPQQAVWQPLQSREQVFAASNYSINAMAASPDGRYLVTGDANGKVMVWDTQRWSTKPKLLDDVGVIESIVFSKAGYYCACGTTSGNIFVWNAHNWSLEPMSYIGYQKPGWLELVGLAFTTDDLYLKWAFADGKIFQWNMEKGRQKPVQLFTGGFVSVNTDFSPDGYYTAAISDGSGRAMWKLDRDFHLSKITTIYTRVLFSPDGRHLAYGLDNGLVAISEKKLNWLKRTVWKTVARLSDELDMAVESSIVCITFSSDGRYFARSTADGRVSLYDRDNGWALVERFEEPAISMAFSPGCTYIALGMADGFVVIRRTRINR